MIGQLATQTGVNVQTVRYYERRGIVIPPARSRSGYRIYGDDDVRRIRFIKQAQELGFSLDEIADLLTLRVEKRRSCAAVERRARLRIADVQRKIQDLRRIQRVLEHLASACSSEEPTGGCPILDALEAPVANA